MKIFKKIGLLFLLTLTIVSCSKNDNGNETSAEGDFFTAKIDGTDWSAFTGPPDTVAWNEAHAGLVVIQGSDANGTAITMNIMNYNGTGTYDFTQAGFIQYVIGPTQTNSGSWVANSASGTSGSVIITSDDGSVIEGTVSFTGLNPQDNTRKVITDGKFRATKQ